MESCFLERKLNGRVARVFVKGAERDFSETYAAEHGVKIDVRRLSLEEMFPLIVGTRRSVMKARAFLILLRPGWSLFWIAALSIGISRFLRIFSGATEVTALWLAAGFLAPLLSGMCIASSSLLLRGTDFFSLLTPNAARRHLQELQQYRAQAPERSRSVDRTWTHRRVTGDVWSSMRAYWFSNNRSDRCLRSQLVLAAVFAIEVAAIPLIGFWARKRPNDFTLGTT